MTDTQMIPFHYGDERLRAYEDEKGTAWFIATDVARILGHRDAANALKGVDEDEKGTTIVSTLKGKQTLSTVSEAGLVTVLMRARVEAAKPFRRWITHEVADMFEDPDYEQFSWTGRYEDDPSFVPKGATARYRVVILHR